MSRSVQHLLDCAAADNLSPDEDFGKAITALKSEGTEGPSLLQHSFVVRQTAERRPLHGVFALPGKALP